MLSINDVSVYCNGRLVVGNVSLNIAKGEKVVLTGKSGAGKTFFIQQIYDGIKGATFTIPKNEVVYLPQNAEQSFNPLRKIRAHFEDVRLGVHQNKQQFYVKVSEYFGILGLENNCLDLWPFQCSGGMLQRLQIVLAHCQSPQLIIADEPTAALDEGHIEKLFAFWNREAAKGMSFLVVTHQIYSYTYFATQMLQLVDQKIEPYQLAFSRGATQSLQASKAILSCVLTGTAYRETGGFWRKKREQVLKIDNFTCFKGQIVGIRGESGSGKTTLLDVLRKQVAFEGTIRIPSIQYVPQRYIESLPRAWHVGELVEEAVRFSDYSEQECVQLLEQLQLPKSVLRKKVHELSGGQSQRLALFRVLVKEPEILLLDEVFSNLDEQSMQCVTEIIQQLVKKGLTVIVVSHDQYWLDLNCHKQYIIEQREVKEHNYE